MRAKFRETGEIPVSEIMLDTTNFRIGLTEDQAECRELLFDEFGEQIVHIAAHISENGLSPKPIVVKKDDGKWVVKDGNRRVAALQILNNPSIAPQEYKPAFIALKDRAKSNGMIPSTVSCLTSDDDKAILDYMQLEHLGPQGGVGQVNWGARAKDNMLLALGGKYRNAIARAVCDYLLAHGVNEAKTVKITNIQRLLQDTTIQARLGLTWDGATIGFSLDEGDVRKVLTEIVLDFASRGKKVSAIYTTNERETYINELFGPRKLQPSALIVPPQQPPTSPTTATTPPPQLGTTTPKGATPPPPIPVPTKPPRVRPRLIPRAQGLRVPPTEPKVLSIINELSNKIDVRDAPISAGVLFRLLIEFSVSNYITVHALTPGRNLHSDISIVAQKMEKDSVIAKSDKEILDKMSHSGNLLSAHTFNKYVHDSRYMPTAVELCTMWDNLYFFLRLCW